MSIKEEPAHYSHIEEEVNGKPWYYDVSQYVKDRQYPNHASENDKRILRRLAMGFLLDGEVLYKKGNDQILLRYVDSSEADRIVEEIHKGVCETHANGHRMAKQVVITVSHLTWMTYQNKWSRNRSFLYECDQSLGIHYLKLRIQKSKFKTNGLVRNNDLEILSPGVRLRVRKD